MRNFRRLIASVAIIGMLIPSIAFAFNDVSEDNVFAPYIAHGVTEGYFSATNEYFYPNNDLTRAELAKIAVVGAGLEEETNDEHDFADVPADNAFYAYVETLLANGMISPNEYFNPNNSVTRAEAAKMLVGAFDYDLDTTGGPTFSDVGADNVFYAYIETAVNNGLVNGYEDGTYKPNNNITRAEAAKILAMATGYTGEWGEAVGVELTISADTVAPGGALTFSAKVVDEDGATVGDYDAAAEFMVSTGTLAERDVEIVNGVATVAYTAPGYGAEGTIVVTVDDYEAEADFSVVIPEDQRMMLYAVDGNINTTDATILYLTISDEEGRPVNGQRNELTFDVVGGDATVTDVEQFPGGADGIYKAVLNTNAAGVGTNVIHVTDNETGETAEMSVEVSQPTMEVYLLDSAVSINQATTALVYLTQGDGSPILGALVGPVLTATFLNNNLGDTDTVAPNEIGDGWYNFTLTASDEAMEDAKVKFSYTDIVPNEHEYASLEIAPYNVSMEIVEEDVNTLTGVATVILSFTDVNGQPITVGAGGGFDLDPVEDIDLDVITAAKYVDPDPTIDDDGFGDANDWFYSHGGANGIVATQIHACGGDSALCTIDDNDIEVVARIKSATNEVVEVEGQLSFSNPFIDEIQAFYNSDYTDDAGVTAPDDGVAVVLTVMDDSGAGVEGLEDEDGVSSHFVVENDEVLVGQVASLGGGLYVLNLDSDDIENDANQTLVATEINVTLGNDDVHDVDVEIETPTALTTYVVYGDTTVMEGVNGNDLRTAAAWINVNGAAGLVDAAPPASTGESPVTIVDPANINDTVTAGPGDVLGVYAYDITVADTDEVDTASLSIDGDNITISVRPIKISHTSVDPNNTATETIYGYVEGLDQDGRLTDLENLVTIDTDGSVDDAEVNGANIAQFNNGAGLPGLYGVRFDRATNNDNSYEEGTVEYQLNGDDEPLYTDIWTFDLVNPTYEVYLQNGTTYVAPNSDIGGAYDASNAIAIVAVVRNDQGVAYNADINGGGLDNDIFAEIKSGDGVVDQALNGTPDDTEPMLNEPTATGVYTINYLSEDDEEELSVVNIYPSWDDNDDLTSFDLSVVYPEAQVLVFPTKIDPDKTNNEATVIAIVRDNFGNAIDDLDTTAEDILVEIDGDNQLTGTELDGTAPANNDNTIYYGKYTTDEVGVQEVVAKYNDDEVIYEGEIVVEMFER